MTTPITAKSIRYQVIDSTGSVLDVFKQMENAVAKVFALASQFRGDKFLVIKKSLHKEEIVLELMMQMNFKFKDVSTVFGGIAKSAEEVKKINSSVWKKEGWRP